MRRVLVLTLVLAVVGVLPAFAQGDRGQIAGFIKDQTGGVIPGATVTVTNSQTRLTWTAVTDARGYYVFPSLPPGAYEISVELQGFKRWIQTGMTLDAASSSTRGRDARNRRADRNRVGHRRSHAAADRCRGPQDRRGQRHRADVVLGAQPDRCREPQSRRDGRQFQQPRLRRPRQRRLQHQRQPRRREHISVDGATADPDAIERHHHRHSERRRHAGSAGPDGQLHARVRARQRRADPLRHQERQQPLQRQRLDLLSRRVAAGQHVDAQTQHQPGRKQRPGAVRLPAIRATRSAARARRTGCGTGSSSSARRNTSTTSSSPPIPRRCRPRRCGAATSASC